MILQNHQIVFSILFVAAGTPSAGPEVWDARLDDLGIFFTEAKVPAGTWYWKLIRAAYENEQESGGTHHIYFKVLDENGDSLENQEVWMAWPTGNPTDSASALTKGKLDDYWGNLAMFGGWCPFWPEGGHGPYGSYVDGLSDEVWGMGLPCNRHVNYRLTWQWTQSAGSGDHRPSISLNPLVFHARTRRGGNPADDFLEIFNSGAGTLNYTATVDAMWVSVVPSSGTSTGEKDTLTVRYQCATLQTGSYDATISIQDPNATNHPQEVQVFLTVSSPGMEGNLIENGDFSRGFTGWSKWTERGSFSASITQGKLHISADNFNGGMWQQFKTPGAGSVVPVRGFWASLPAVAGNQWAEVLIINGPRTPADGQDIKDSQEDVVLLYKNDTWASAGGWTGEMEMTSPVASSGEFIAADAVATIILKSGNLGGAVTGTQFDDIFVGEPSTEDPQFYRGDANGDGALDISDAIKIIASLFMGVNLSCQDAADANDDGEINLSDVIILLNFLFLNGSLPSSTCGPDSTLDELDCEEYTVCL